MKKAIKDTVFVFLFPTKLDLEWRQLIQPAIRLFIQLYQRTQRAVQSIFSSLFTPIHLYYITNENKSHSIKSIIQCVN